MLHFIESQFSDQFILLLVCGGIEFVSEGSLFALVVFFFSILTGLLFRNQPVVRTAGSNNNLTDQEKQWIQNALNENNVKTIQIKVILNKSNIHFSFNATANLFCRTRLFLAFIQQRTILGGARTITVAGTANEFHTDFPPCISVRFITTKCCSFVNI